MNFKLKLLNWIRFYPMFYVKKLELVDPEMPVQTKELSRLSQYNKYEIKKIKDYNPETY